MGETEKLINILASHNIQISIDLKSQLEWFLIEVMQTQFHDGKAAGMMAIKSLGDE